MPLQAHKTFVVLQTNFPILNCDPCYLQDRTIRNTVAHSGQQKKDQRLYPDQLLSSLLSRKCYRGLAQSAASNAIATVKGSAMDRAPRLNR
jgi:hypothetical protein